jgi:hypothetical protein
LAIAPRILAISRDGRRAGRILALISDCHQAMVVARAGKDISSRLLSSLCSAISVAAELEKRSGGMALVGDNSESSSIGRPETSDSFQSYLAQYALSSPMTPLRRSPRSREGKRSLNDDGEDKSESTALKGIAPRAPDIGTSNTKRNTRASANIRLSKKAKRGYADPEVYAHLSNLPDHLKEDLDGIARLCILRSQLNISVTL